MTKQTLIEALRKNAKISEAEAESVYELYRKLRIIRFTGSAGIQISDGGFLDADVIHRAVAEAAA